MATKKAAKVDKVDKTVERDETRVKPSASSRKSRKGDVRLDPQGALLPGNTVTFVADEGEGVVQAKIITAKDSWLVAASNTAGGARVSKIIETGHGEITVEFYEDGKLYASGTWTVGA